MVFPSLGSGLSSYAKRNLVINEVLFGENLLVAATYANTAALVWLEAYTRLLN